MPKKVLIVGGSYFIGKAMTDAFLQNGFAVTLLSRGSKRIDRTWQLNCDRNDENALKQVLAGKVFDWVVDVSGLNRLQMEKLLSALELSFVEKFLFISSSSVYAVDELNPPYRETDELGENSYWTDYGRNKIEAEAYLFSALANTEIKLTILRPPYVYGENNHVQRESFVFRHALQNKPIILPKKDFKLQFIYAPDLANTALALLSQEQNQHEIYNVGNAQSISAEEWVRMCSLAVGKEVHLLRYDNLADGIASRVFFPFPDYDNYLDVSRIKAIIPEETSFADGLQSALKWYRAVEGEIAWNENMLTMEEKILEKLGYPQK